MFQITFLFSVLIFATASERCHFAIVHSSFVQTTATSDFSCPIKNWNVSHVTSLSNQITPVSQWLCHWTFGFFGHVNSLDQSDQCVLAASFAARMRGVKLARGLASRKNGCRSKSVAPDLFSTSTSRQWSRKSWNTGDSLCLSLISGFPLVAIKYRAWKRKFALIIIQEYFITSNFVKLIHLNFLGILFFTLCRYK